MGLMSFRNSPVLRRLGNALSRMGAVDPVVVRESVIQTEIVRESSIHKTGIEQPWGFRAKDVSNEGLRRMRDQARSAWINHPLAKKGMRTKRAFVCQEGFRIEATCADDKKRKAVQEYIDEHWAINWEGKSERRVESLGVYGELVFWRPPANTRTGQYEIGAISRDDVAEVLPDTMNAERVGMIRTNVPQCLWIDGEKRSQDLFHVYRYDWLKQGHVGEVIYCAVNRLDDMMRGVSDLAPILDWLNVFDQLTYTEAERAKMLRSLLFHLKMRGENGGDVSPDVLKKKRDDLALRPPPPGSWYVSNFSEEIEVLSPDLNTSSSLELIKYIFGLASGCMDLPEHYYYSAGNVNRASAKEMVSPIYAGIRDRKREFADLLLQEHAIALEVASKIESSKVAGFTSEELAIEVRSRDPERDALDVIGQHLLAFGQGLLLATGEGWIDKRQAGQQFRQAASAMGLDELDDPGQDSGQDLESLQGMARAAMEHRRPLLDKTGVYPLSLSEDLEDPNWSRRLTVAR